MGRKKKPAGDEQMCRRKFRKWRCKNASVDNELGYCEKHYKAITDSCSKRRLTKKEEEKLKNTSGDGEGASCSATGVETRGSKSRKKVTDQSLDETGGTQPLPTTDIEVGSASAGTKRKIVEGTEESGELDFTDLLTENPPLITSNKMMKKKKGIGKDEIPPDEQYCAITGFGGWRCKNFRMGLGAADNENSVPKSKHCEKHYILRANYYENVKKKSRDGEGAGTGHIETEEDMEKKNLPQQYCCQTDGKRWRCKNLRMGLGASGDDSVLKTRYCEKHYNCRVKSYKNLLKKRCGDGESAGCSTATGPVEIRSSKRTKNVTEEDETEEIQPATSNDTCSAKIGTKRKKVEKPERSGNLNSLTKIGEPVAELESLEHYKSKCSELSVELENKKVELEKKEIECTKLQGKYAELETKKTPAEDVDAVKYWRNKCSDLESLVLKMEAENSTMRCEVSRVSNLDSLITSNGKESSILRCEELRNSEKIESEVRGSENEITETGGNQESLVLRMKIQNPTMQCGVSRVSNLESLVTRNGKESSILRCEELRNFEKIESEVRGSQNEIIETSENQRDKDNKSTLNAETSSGGRKDSRVDELKTDVNKHHKSESEFPKYSALNISCGSLHLASGGENVEEGKGWGCSEGRPFEHGSSSQAHLEMSKKIFVNLVSDSDDESVDSLGDPMDMLATKNWNRNKHEMKWKSEVDMLSSFEEDPGLCMRAVCALYRQEISEDEISPKGLVIDSDTLRCTTLAKFLMDNDCKGDVKKSMKELEKFDSKAVGDCKKLVRRYSMYLFDIYKKRKDPFFLPATISSNVDQTAK